MWLVFTDPRFTCSYNQLLEKAVNRQLCVRFADLNGHAAHVLSSVSALAMMRELRIPTLKYRRFPKPVMRSELHLTVLA